MTFVEEAGAFALALIGAVVMVALYNRYSAPGDIWITITVLLVTVVFMLGWSAFVWRWSDHRD